MVLLYMVQHLPSIYPLYVSIYTIHGPYGNGFIYIKKIMDNSLGIYMLNGFAFFSWIGLAIPPFSSQQPQGCVLNRSTLYNPRNCPWIRSFRGLGSPRQVKNGIQVCDHLFVRGIPSAVTQLHILWVGSECNLIAKKWGWIEWCKCSKAIGTRIHTWDHVWWNRFHPFSLFPVASNQRLL